MSIGMLAGVCARTGSAGPGGNGSAAQVPDIDPQQRLSVMESIPTGGVHTLEEMRSFTRLLTRTPSRDTP